jgi:hypothetical protein
LKTLIPIKTTEWHEDNFAVACDFDRKNRLAALVQRASGEVSIQVDRNDYAIPARWREHVRKIRWCGNSDIVLWPVCLPTENVSNVGRVGPSGAEILNLKYPLDIFSDRGLLACTFSEDWFILTDDISLQSDLISVFSCGTMERLARFVEPYMKDFKHIPFLEVEHGALDGASRRIWFTAYVTDFLWCFTFDDLKVSTCKLECDRNDVIAISCLDDKCLLLVQRANLIFLQVYRAVADNLAFDTERVILLSGDSSRQMTEISDRSLGIITGYVGGRVAAMTESRATLFELQ